MEQEVRLTLGQLNQSLHQTSRIIPSFPKHEREILPRGGLPSLSDVGVSREAERRTSGPKCEAGAET